MVLAMRSVEISEARKRLSSLIERAIKGERIGITRRGKLAAILEPAPAQISLKRVFDDIEAIRKRAKRSQPFSVKELIEEGRR